MKIIVVRLWNTLKVIMIMSLFLLSCSKWDKDKDRFTETYKEILIVRNKVSDSAQANVDVNKIIKKYGYSKESFRDTYFKYFSNYETYKIISDSAQKRAQRDLMKMNKRMKE